MKEYVSYFRHELDAMEGYAPGEQPKCAVRAKLNTNENPFPPSPGVLSAIRNFDAPKLRLYPDPTADELRQEIADRYALTRDNVIAGNGSDDILNIAVRCFADAKHPVATLRPSYSLYPTLARLQGAECRFVDLKEDFSLPDDLLTRVQGTRLLLIARPNAPTGNTFPREIIAEICRCYDGVVLIDEAYADFADDDCVDFVRRYPNVIISRTFSKSRSLAGLRFGFALAHEKIIAGMMKMKDSYNVSLMTQKLALASLQDEAFFVTCVSKVKLAREMLFLGLQDLGFRVMETQTNFVFASPPDGDGERYFRELRKRGILVRYFPGPVTGAFVRITAGSTADAALVFSESMDIYKNQIQPLHEFAVSD